MSAAEKARNSATNRTAAKAISGQILAEKDVQKWSKVREKQLKEQKAELVASQPSRAKKGRSKKVATDSTGKGTTRKSILVSSCSGLTVFHSLY